MVRTSYSERRATFLAFSLACALHFFAAAPGSAIVNPPPQTARFMHFTVDHGLSQNTVRAILQDRHGFIWFATEEGLNRYDGYTFFKFKHNPNDSRTLPNDVVTALHEDRSGRLWVGTRGGVCYYDSDNETFHRRLRVQEEVMAILEDHRGRLWVGTAGAGVFRLDGMNAEPIRYVAGDQPSDLSNNTIYALLEDHAGRLWMGTFGGGLNQLDEEKGRILRYAHDPTRRDSLGHNEIWSLAEDRAGRIWIGTNGRGASTLDPSTGRFDHFRYDPRDPSSLQGDVVSSLYVDSQGTVWLGTDSAGLNRLVAGTRSFLAYRHASHNPDSLGWNAVRAIYEDRQGNLWVSTFASGVNWLRRNTHPFRHFRPPLQPKGLTGASIASFLQDRDGTLWAGGEGWLHRFDVETQTFASYPIDQAPVLEVHQDPQGRIWVGTWGKGLLRFDPTRGTFAPFHNRLQNPSTREDEQLWAISSDSQGGLWLATDNGVFRIEPDTGRAMHFSHDPEKPGSLGHNKARAFHRDEAGNLWIGTLGAGISVLPQGGNTFIHYRHEPSNPKSLSNDWVIALHKDVKGRLWVGTFGGGLNLFDTKTRTFTTYGDVDGLPSNVVYSILEDDRGRLWLSTNRGLCRFDPELKRAETFDTTNGLQSLQFNLGAALRLRSGDMLFGSWDGFYSFDPDHITPDTKVPPLIFTSLKLLHEPPRSAAALSRTDEIRLDWDEKMLTVEFVILDYTFPRRNKYAYMLEGFNQNWIQLNERRDVTFTNLDPGSYVLRVKGTNADGIWDENGRALRIFIAPPFWATWWFRTVFLATVLCGAFGFYRYRIRAHEQRERELELRVEEAMSKLKVLKGLLPICATCKKVRDDRGYWNQIESYLRTHSEADFSHGICPDCIVKYWGHTRAAAAVKKRES